MAKMKFMIVLNIKLFIEENISPDIFQGPIYGIQHG